MSASRRSKILRVARSDEQDNDLAVILHIQPTAATIPLNVTITATDGSDSYGLTLKDSKTKALKDPSSEQADDDWKAVLRAVLLSDAPSEACHLLTNIQLTALVKKDGISVRGRSSPQFYLLALRRLTHTPRVIKVSIQEDVGGIRRRLGVLQLAPQDAEIELWDWLDHVCRDKQESEARCSAADQRAIETKAKLEALEKQLQLLSLAKKQHEGALILRFQRLLNGKKKKIRELSGAMTGQGRTHVSEVPRTISGKKRKQAEGEELGLHSGTSDESSLGPGVEVKQDGNAMELVGAIAEDQEMTSNEDTHTDDDTDDDEL